eukprot:2208927-Pleurochrysis_carterae.AAC.1
MASSLRRCAFLSGSFAAVVINGSLPGCALRLSRLGVSRVLPAVGQACEGQAKTGTLLYDDAFSQQHVHKVCLQLLLR